MIPRLKIVILCMVLGAFTAGYAHAQTYIFVTPSGSSTSGGPVDASATFTVGTGTLDITLTNLESNPKDVAQSLSDLEFTLSTGQTSGTLASSSGDPVDITSTSTASTPGTAVSTGWGLNNNVKGGLQLDALGYSGPAYTIIGPGVGAGSDVYSNANSSIVNVPHNPFIWETGTFVLDIPGITTSTVVTSATFSFGTTAGTDDVPGGGQTPEPATMLLFGSGLLALGGFLRRRKGTAIAA